MFNNIAPSYDLLNHLLSLNIDHYWRWRTTQLAPPRGEAPILDLCTGTGDLALAYDRAAGRRLSIVGADFCHEMLVRAQAKTERRAARSSAASTAFTSATSCRASARRSRAARTTPTATCPPACWSSPTAPPWPSGCGDTDCTTCAGTRSRSASPRSTSGPSQPHE